MRAFAPNGLAIVKTLETVQLSYGLAEDGFSKKDASVGFEYDGGESEIFWDTAEPVEREGKVVFMDGDGNEWTEDQLILREGEDRPDLPSKEAIADAFVAVLRDWLSEEEFAEMQRRNAAMAPGSTSCASHDFCDANMAMAQAFEKLGYREFDAGNQEQADRWNEAWKAAMPQLGRKGGEN